MPHIICEICRKKAYKRPCEVAKAKFCSYKCKYIAQTKRTPGEHGRWLGGVRTKLCVGCFKPFHWEEQRKPYSTFLKQKYCTLDCSREHQTEYVCKGKDKPNWNGGPQSPQAERASAYQTKEYKEWRKSVFERDNYTCQFCGYRGGDLNADHIKTWAEFPDLRYKVSNGRTLCVPCHRTTFKFHKNQYSK